MAAAKRDAILAAALPFLAEGAEFSLEELLRVAGAGVGTFYHHFPEGRADLEAALRAWAAADYEEGVLRLLERNRDAETGVKALVHHQARWLAEHAASARLLPGRPGPELLRAVRGWVRAVGLEGVSADELLAYTVAPLTVASGPDRLAAASWAAVRELAAGEKG